MFPTKSESASVEQALAASGVARSAVQDFFLALQRDEFKLEDDGLANYIAAQKVQRPHLFEKAVVDAEANVAQAATELEIAAFERGHVQSRGELVKKLGKDAADERARAWGITGGVADFKSKPVKPVVDDDDPSKTKKPDDGRDNPWLAGQFNITKQGQLVRALGIEKASAIAKAAGSFVGATRPSQ